MEMVVLGFPGEGVALDGCVAVDGVGVVPIDEGSQVVGDLGI